MPTRLQDVITIETQEGSCQLLSNCDLTQDFHDVSSMSLTIGDDGSWRTISKIVAPGRIVKLSLNGRLQFTGRFEENEVPVDTGQGAVAQVTARTKMSDARYASADPKTKFQDVSIKQFLLALYKPLGYTEADFIFDAETDRNLLTGEKRGAKALVDLDPMQEGKAKVKPPETIFDAATRHLKRFHLTHWDAADGRIVVGKPEDAQAPIFALLGKRGAAAQANNVLTARRVRDWSEVPSQVRAFGTTINDDNEEVPFAGIATDADLVAVSKLPGGHFSRPVHMPVEGLKTKAKAIAQATRELAARSKRKDAWEVSVDGWTFWNGQRSIPWAINCTADVDIEVIGAEASGRYLIHRLHRTLDVHGAGTSRISLVAPGVLVF
jgi:prophage tail gpP-like protein